MCCLLEIYRHWIWKRKYVKDNPDYKECYDIRRGRYDEHIFDDHAFGKFFLYR